ncbi:unnamed protein product [Urochloa humidicola]
MPSSPVAAPDHPSSPVATLQPTSPKSSLSPAARPFYPGDSTAGRSKELRWLDGSDNELEHVDYSFTLSPSASPRPSSYRDVLCRPSPPPAKGVMAGQGDGSTALAEVAAAMAPVEGTPMGRRGRHRQSRRAQKRRRRPPLRVANAPRRAEAGQAPSPVTQSWPRIDADGFQMVLSRSTHRRLRRSEAAPSHSSPSRRIPQELAGRCLNCLSYNHRVVTCRLPRRCLRCRGFRHLARDCRRPRTPHGRRQRPQPPSPPLDRWKQPPPPARRSQSPHLGQRRQAVLETQTTACSSRQTLPWRPVRFESDITAAIDFELKCCRADWFEREEDPMLVEANATPLDALVTCQESPGPAILAAEQRGVPAPDELAFPAADLFTATDECPPAVDRAAISEVEQCVVDVVATPVPPVKVLPNCSVVSPSVEVMVPVSAEATAMVVAPEVDSSAALEDFINKVTKDIPAPLLDKPTRRRRVDPVLIDAPPQLPSSEASGLRRSLRQALDPLSAVKTARRGEMILMRRLGEIGVPLPLAASADQAVKQFFLEGPAPHHMGALLDIYPMLKTKSTTSPSVGLSVD